MSRFVRPEVTTLHLTNGDTLTVKRRLNAGEERAMFAQLYIAGVNGRLTVNPLQTGIARVIAYLVDWSLTDDAGHHVPYRGESPEIQRAALDNLDPEDFTEIRQAVEAHEKAMDAARAEEKKRRAGATTASVI